MSQKGMPLIIRVTETSPTFAAHLRTCCTLGANRGITHGKNLQQVRASPAPVRRSALLALLVAGILALSVVSPAGAVAGVSGQKEAWPVEFGTGSGQLFDPQAFGVDPVDGSVYVLTNEAGFNAFRVSKFSASGTFEGSVSISRTPDEPGVLDPKGIVGIAVDHAQSRFYLVEDERELWTLNPEAPVATKVLAFSTVPNASQQLEPAATPSFGLPAANDPAALIFPTEVQIDPSNGDLVLAAETPTGAVVLQRIDDTGALGSRYVESGTALRSFNGLRNPNFGFVVASDGTTYIVANTGTEAPGAWNMEALTLPPGFQPPSGPLTLTALPGFTAAATAEEWGATSFAMLSRPANATGDSFGPQVALTIAPDGEETLLWKAGDGQHEPEEVVRIHGYSLQQQATTVVYGGGSGEGECSIETQTAAIAATTSGDLMVLDQGEFVAEASTEPGFGPNVLRFGPGGSDCPGPAPLVKLESGANEVSTVPAGTSVTLDASGSELGSLSLAGLTWMIEGPGGPQAIPIAGPAPALETAHVFSAEGQYTVGLAVKTSEGVEFVGSEFTAKPRKLTVTAGPPAVTSLDPNHGPAAGGNSVEIIGTNLENATKVEFGGVTANSPFTEDTATKIELAAPPCTAGQTVHVKVTTGGGTSTTSSADEYTCDLPGAPTVTGISPSHGPAAGGTSVTITGTDLNGATQVRFGSTAGTGITQVSATELKASSPPGTAGSKVDITVVTAGGTSATGSGDRFTYDVGTQSLNVLTAGTGAGTVSCNGARCLSEYPAGATVTIVASPAAGSTFVGWSGACSAAGNCVVVLSTGTTVTATFNLSGGSSGNQAGGSNGGSGGSSGSSGSGGSSGSSGSSSGSGGTAGAGGRTEAQKLKEKRKKALTRCKKLSGKAKAQCIKRANQIGKPKKKS